jgi:hypothetical protein
VYGKVVRVWMRRGGSGGVGVVVVDGLEWVGGVVFGFMRGCEVGAIV